MAARRKTPYENQLIAAFVYSLGYASGRRENALPFAVNLFQQTPLDQRFGDLIAGYKFCVALEFKRSADEVSTERAKWPPKGISKFLRDKDLCRRADLAHRLVFGDIARKPGIFFCAYRPLLADPLPPLGAHNAARLVSALCSGAQIGLPPDEADAYLRAIAQLRDGGGPDGPPDGGPMRSSKHHASAWLAVAHNGNGELALIAASSLAELLGLDHDSRHDPGTRKRREQKYFSSGAAG